MLSGEKIEYKFKYWLSFERTGVDRISRRIESKGNGLTKLQFLIMATSIRN